MPNTYEILHASLQLTELSNSSGLSTFYCSAMFTDWDESSTWNSPGVNNAWIAPGAFHSTDSDLPSQKSHFDVSLEEKFCDITAIMQKAIVNGDENMSIIIQPEYDVNGAIQGQFLFADSENPNIDSRPKLVLEYRTTNPWLPQPPQLTTPGMGDTLWNNSSPIPQNADSVLYSFIQGNTNATDWEFCTSYDQRIYECIDSVSDLQEYPDWQFLPKEDLDRESIELFLDIKKAKRICK